MQKAVLLRSLPVAILIMLLLSSVLSGCMLPGEEDILPPDLLKPEEVVFQTIEVERGTIQDVLEDSVIAGSAVHYDMTFHDRSGFLAELSVRSGQEVNAGDVLARLDTGSLEIDIQLQNIEVEKRKLALDELTRLGSSRFARRNAELDLEMAELRLLQLEEELEKSTILAPVDGEIIFMSDYKVGEFVSGQSIVMIVADPTQVQFEYTGPQTARIRYGMDAHIIIDSQRIPARVSMTPNNAPAEERTRLRNTVIFSLNDLNDLPNNVRLGSRHHFNIFIEEKNDVVLVPVGAMSNFMGQRYVQVLENGMRTERDLEIGIVSRTHAEVLSGLEEGEILIIGIER